MALDPHLKRKLLSLPVLFLAFSWIADAVLDMFIISTCGPAHFLGRSTSLLAHAGIIVVQLGFVLYVWNLLKNEQRLKDSLEAARFQAEEGKARMEAIMEAMADSISVQDRDFTILYQNHAHRSLTGDHLGEKCYSAYMQHDAVCEGCHLLMPFREGVPHRREASLERGAEVRHLEILASPLKDAAGNVTAAIEVIRDITERKNSEEKIRKLNADLERQACELQAACRELEAFSYSASHDLRAPLTRIYSSAQLLADEYVDRLDEDGRFIVRAIREASEQMEELIEALMTLSQVSSTTVTRVPVDLAALAREIVSDLQQADPERVVGFAAPPALMVTGDRKLLKVLMENLLDNAWKYTRYVASSTIEVGRIEKDGRDVYCIRDNGAGFDMKEYGRMFKPFNRLHRADEFPGTGIGLATVQRVVERHGGAVWAEGEPGRGACFYFTLP